MRRMKRSILRHRAEKKGVKPSRYVMTMWDKLQKRKVGAARRRANKAHGALPKRKWKNAA